MAERLCCFFMEVGTYSKQGGLFCMSLKVENCKNVELLKKVKSIYQYITCSKRVMTLNDLELSTRTPCTGVYPLIKSLYDNLMRTHPKTLTTNNVYDLIRIQGDIKHFLNCWALPVRSDVIWKANDCLAYGRHIYLWEDRISTLKIIWWQGLFVWRQNFNIKIIWSPGSALFSFTFNFVMKCFWPCGGICWINYSACKMYRNTLFPRISCCSWLTRNCKWGVNTSLSLPMFWHCTQGSFRLSPEVSVEGTTSQLKTGASSSLANSFRFQLPAIGPVSYMLKLSNCRLITYWHWLYLYTWILKNICCIEIHHSKDLIKIMLNWRLSMHYQSAYLFCYNQLRLYSWKQLLQQNLYV